MALVGEQPLWYDSFVVDPEAPPFDAGDLPYDYQFHPRELPMAAVLAEPAHDDGWTNATTGGVSSCSSPSSSVLTFDGQGEEYCAPWMDATDQVISHGASTTAVATVLASLAARQAGTGSVTSTCFSFGGCGSRGMAVDGAATQKRPRAHAHAPSQQETTTAKQQCGGDRRATKSSKTPAITPTPPKKPQSLAAKNRRERISERLRELQELVPNGGKVDMVTMLDRAIAYVKFMQLQLKVLETDAFWPVQGGKAPEISQVKDALDAIILSSSSSSSSSYQQADTY